MTLLPYFPGDAFDVTGVVVADLPDKAGSSVAAHPFRQTSLIGVWLEL